MIKVKYIIKIYRNFLNHLKQYDDAIEMYNQAI